MEIALETLHVTRVLTEKDNLFAAAAFAPQI
jgi:hypothetical protein